MAGPRASQTFGSVFLEEQDATIIVFDLRGFTRLTAELTPLDLGFALGHYYLHCEASVTEHGGRMVKFAGDIVLAAWLEKEAPEHKTLAVKAAATAIAKRDAWLVANQKDDYPVLDYSIGVATGPILAGHIGTPRLKTFDVLGAPVTVAGKIATAATMRGVDHLLAVQVAAPPTLEVEPIELGGQMIRLFRLAPRS